MNLGVSAILLWIIGLVTSTLNSDSMNTGIEMSESLFSYLLNFYLEIKLLGVMAIPWVAFWEQSSFCYKSFKDRRECNTLDASKMTSQLKVHRLVMTVKTDLGAQVELYLPGNFTRHNIHPFLLDCLSTDLSCCTMTLNHNGAWWQLFRCLD